MQTVEDDLSLHDVIVIGVKEMKVWRGETWDVSMLPKVLERRCIFKPSWTEFVHLFSMLHLSSWLALLFFAKWLSIKKNHLGENKCIYTKSAKYMVTKQKFKNVSYLPHWSEWEPRLCPLPRGHGLWDLRAILFTLFIQYVSCASIFIQYYSHVSCFNIHSILFIYFKEPSWELVQIFQRG